MAAATRHVARDGLYATLLNDCRSSPSTPRDCEQHRSIPEIAHPLPNTRRARMHSLTSSIPQRRNVREVSSELCSTPSACHNAQERRVLLALSVQARFVLQFQRSHHAPIFLPTVPILSSHSTRGLRCAPAQPGAPVRSCSSCHPAAKMSRALRGRCETVESGAPMRRDLDGGEAQHHLAEEAGEQAAAVGAHPLSRGGWRAGRSSRSPAAARNPAGSPHRD